MGWLPNPAKFEMMFLGKKVDTKLHLNVNGKIIQEDELVKLLGVTIDSNLNCICFELKYSASFHRLDHRDLVQIH